MKNNRTATHAALFSLALLAQGHAALTVTRAEITLHSFAYAISPGEIRPDIPPTGPTVPTTGGAWQLNEASDSSPGGTNASSGGGGESGIGDDGISFSGIVYSAIGPYVDFAASTRADARLEVDFMVSTTSVAIFSLSEDSFLSGLGGSFSSLALTDISIPSGGFSVLPGAPMLSYVLEPSRPYTYKAALFTLAGGESGFARSDVIASMNVTPVPETSSLMLGALGILALARRRRS